jgi:hypothetical protein
MDVSPTNIFINPLNAKLNAICHLLALLGAHHILHVSRLRLNWQAHSSLLVQFTVKSSHTILHMCSSTVHTTTCVMWFSLSLETVMHHSLIISKLVNIHFTWDWCTATSSIFFPVLDCWHISAVYCFNTCRVCSLYRVCHKWNVD